MSNTPETLEKKQRVQLHLVLPYKFDAIEHPEVARLLADGYLIRQLQRVTDREVIITLALSV